MELFHHVRLNCMLILFFGDIGVGKSTVAGTLARMFQLPLIQFDPLVPSVTGKEEMYGEDNAFLLSDEEVDAVHAEMRANAKKFLESGESVILEFMFFKEQREKAIALAEDARVSFHLVEVVCDESEVKNRIKKRIAENSQSAGEDLFLENKGQVSDELREHIILDTTGKSVEECVWEVARKIGLSEDSRE